MERKSYQLQDQTEIIVSTKPQTKRRVFSLLTKDNSASFSVGEDAGALLEAIFNKMAKGRKSSGANRRH